MNSDQADVLLAFIEGNWSKNLTEDEASAWLIRLLSPTLSFELGRSILESFVHRPADPYNATARVTPNAFAQRLRGEQNREVQIATRRALNAAPDPDPEVATMWVNRLIEEHHLRTSKTSGPSK